MRDGIRKLAGLLAANLLVLLVLAAGVEAGLAALMARSEPTGVAKLDTLARRIYWSRVSYIQYDPDCARHDPELGYTLRPGRCRFANDGFSTEVTVNSAGVRDDEASLEAPEIIVIGDSQAMGWGVEDSETFAALIEAETGRRTLNTAVSSYGTAREILMLRRQDLSRVDTLIVQYSDNDAWENRTYLQEGTAFESLDAETYAALVKANPEPGYTPGAYLHAVFRILGERFRPPEDEAAAPEDGGERLSDPDAFLGVLAQSPLSGGPVDVIILELSTHGRGNEWFLDALRRSERLDSVKDLYGQLEILRLRDVLGPEDRYFPDGHINAAGHRKVADAVLRALAPLHAAGAPD